MRELEAVSGLPRSTIHYYLREGILPASEKTARNAAAYGKEHLRRLDAIGRLRQTGVRLPLVLLKRAAELMDRGVEPEVAIELERAVLGSAPVEGPSEALSQQQLAKTAGVPVSFVRRMIKARLLVPLPGPRPTFDATDLKMVRVAYPLSQATGLDLEVATHISDAIRDLSRYEMVLRNRAVEGRDEAESAELTLRIQEAVNLIHAYLFYRWRLHDIAELRRQEAEDRKGEEL
jgi:DNA-binding transcriptional MerR regulator